MADVQTGTMIEIPQGELGPASSLVPDTPWTTLVAQACERRSARIWVDSRDQPKNLAVVVPGVPDEDLPPGAFLFGSGGKPDVLVSFALGLERPHEILCEDDVGEALAAAHAETVVRDHSVHWFETLDTGAQPLVEGLRRLRLTDAAAVDALPIPGLLRVMSSSKDLLMIGGAYGIFEGDRLVAAAFTGDLSVNYARIVPFVVPERRRGGLATVAAQRLIVSHHEQGRLACMVVPDREPVLEAFARGLGFEQSARITSYRLE